MFKDRRDAGEKLAEALRGYRREPHALVLALPRGGVVVGHAVSRALGLPLDVFISQKLYAPWDPELAIGAVTETGFVYLDEDKIQKNPIPSTVLEDEIRLQELEAERRRRVYRGGRPLPAVEGRTILLVDDGVATGATLLAAVKVLHGLRPKWLVAAIPVGAPATLALAGEFANEVVCLAEPQDFEGVARYYWRFDAVDDEAILRCLGARVRHAAARR